MTPTLIGLMAGLVVLILLWPGPMPGRPTALSRLYARLGGVVRARAAAGSVPWVRKVPVGPLVVPLRSLMSARYRENTERLLRISRLDRTHSYDDILAMKVALVLLPLFYTIAAMAKGANAFTLGCLLLMLPVTFIYPDSWVATRARKRQHMVRRELPAILSALAVALEAGLHLMGAVGEVVRDRKGFLAEELSEAVDLSERGVPAAQALELITRRLEVPELTMVTAALLQAFAKGSGQVVKAVRTQANEAWLQRKRRAETLAQTASVRLFLPIALLALPGFMIFLLGPAVLEIIGYFAN